MRALDGRAVVREVSENTVTKQAKADVIMKYRLRTSIVGLAGAMLLVAPHVVAAQAPPAKPASQA